MTLLYARTPLSIESIDIKEDFQLRLHSRERTAVLLHGWRDDREKEKEKEREKEVGSTRRECRLTDASVARASAMGKAAYLLEKSTLLQPPARLFEFAQLRPRFLHNANYKLCALPPLEYACITLSFPSNLLAVYLCRERERERLAHKVCVHFLLGAEYCVARILYLLPIFR